MGAFGFDIGGVFIQHQDASSDTSFRGDNYLSTPEVEGVFDAMATLAGFGDKGHIISFCGKETQRRSIEWLIYHGLERRTGIPVTPERVHFVPSRQAKGPVAKKLELAHFVDDKLEVLGFMGSVPNRLLFQPRPGDVAEHARTGSQFPIIWNMPATTRAILQS